MIGEAARRAVVAAVLLNKQLNNREKTRAGHRVGKVMCPPEPILCLLTIDPFRVVHPLADELFLRSEILQIIHVVQLRFQHVIQYSGGCAQSVSERVITLK